MNKWALLNSVLLQKIRRKTSPPINLHLETINTCNFTCRYCFSRIYPETMARKSRPSHMPSDQVYSILKKAWDFGCKNVMYGGWGEPTIHPDYYRFLSWSKDIGYSLSCTTNGWNLDPKKMDMLDKKDLIRISIDSMHRNGSPDPSGYIERMRHLFANNPNNFRIIAVAHGTTDSTIESFFNDCGIEVLHYALQKQAGSGSGDDKKRSLIRCVYPWISLSVLTDLKVSPCPCVLHHTIGQVDDKTSLGDIWFGETMENFRNELSSENIPEICRSCDRANRMDIQWIEKFIRQK